MPGETYGAMEFETVTREGSVTQRVIGRPPEKACVSLEFIRDAAGPFVSVRRDVVWMCSIPYRVTGWDERVGGLTMERVRP